VTPFVNAEITKGIQAHHESLRDIKSAAKLGLIKEISLAGAEENSLFESLSRCLGSGEASRIAVAKRRGLTFASDDKVARREAARLGVKVTGTLGILKNELLPKNWTGGIGGF
jgi:predicted nucleic acid-binding protein